MFQLVLLFIFIYKIIFEFSVHYLYENWAKKKCEIIEKHHLNNLKNKDINKKSKTKLNWIFCLHIFRLLNVSLYFIQIIKSVFYFLK